MFKNAAPDDSPRTWSVSQLTGYLKGLLEADPGLQDLWVEGEISNLARPASGHLYFSLKDQASSLRCVMWKSQAQRAGSRLKEGAAVLAHGSLSVYEQRGQVQLYIDYIRPRGEGELYQEFQRLKERLGAEGLFDPERKRPIPSQPERIGVVTSPTGAAFQDIRDTLARRYPLARVLLSPSAVQGEAAPPELIAALERLYHEDPDLIIIARGGGSIEDLWAFNDESLARTIVESPVPVISGVGHETDFTITDFVADLRAPTPTAAAELAVPDQNELRLGLGETRDRLFRVLGAGLSDRRWKLEGLANQLKRLSPASEIGAGRQRLDEISLRLGREIEGYLERSRSLCRAFQDRLVALNPEEILRRGYAVVTAADGTVVYQVEQAGSGQRLQVRVSDGSFEVTVE